MSENALEEEIKEIQLDLDRLGQKICAALERNSIFTEVAKLKNAGEVSEAESSELGKNPSHPREAFQEAQELGADLLLEARFPRLPACRFSRRTAWFIPNTLLWFFVGFPSWWVRDSVYEVQWDVDFTISSVPARKIIQSSYQPFLEEKPVSVSEQGWTWTALITPPGYYEGPKVPSSLAPLVEEKMEEYLLRFLENTPLPFPVDIHLAAEDPTRLQVEIKSPTPLEKFRLEVDGRVILEKNPLTMWPPFKGKARNSADLPYFYSRYIPLDLSPGTHKVRVLALASQEKERVVSLEASGWSASQTISINLPEN
ncbi:MAG: hypothetical protein HY717_21350 [Planctomycetes bacterium]|nr:hypothetical protein [Planctomycetota bacterium]